MTRYICASGVFTSREIEDRLCCELDNYERHGVQYFPVFLRETGELVGCCGLRPYGEEPGVYELGFHLRPKFWHQGFAVEVARAMMGWAFSELGATRLMAGHNPKNVASGKVLAKLGFHYERDEYYAPTGLDHPLYSCQP